MCMCVHLLVFFMFLFFLFKQKTAYEMRISDWSSDVCSSDLCWVILRLHFPTQIRRSASPFGRPERCQRCDNRNATNLVSPIGRPCSREGCRDNWCGSADWLRSDLKRSLRTRRRERKSVVEGRCRSVRGDHGGRRRNKKTKTRC